MEKEKTYSQMMKSKIFHITAGRMICVLNERDAKELGVIAGDRLEIKNKSNGRRAVGIVDISSMSVKEKGIGLFEEVANLLKINGNELVEVKATPPLKSVEFIKNKMNGERLNQKEFDEIVKDITDCRLNDIEASAFVSAVYMKELNMKETAFLTKSLINNGQRISFDVEPVVDKHSVGGINGRATMLVIPIVASAGLYIPKTSSRSITSVAGTADAMEVLAPVNLSFDKIKDITKKTGGVIAWGGAVDLAPADDKIIQVRHPLSLDPEGMLIASVLSKKASVGSKYVVIDLPVGPNAKIKNKKKALEMAKKFVFVGKQIGMEVEAIITDGSSPSGLAFGPALESKYVLEILEGKRFDNLAKKSCELAGSIFELAGLRRQGQGYHFAEEILKSGKALAKMQEIIYAQGGKIDKSTKLILSPLNKEIKAKESGIITEMDIAELTKIARYAGAPANKLAGIMLAKTIGEKINAGEKIMTIYAENARKLDSAIEEANKNSFVEIKKVGKNS